jgi:hypothetical protein
MTAARLSKDVEGAGGPGLDMPRRAGCPCTWPWAGGQPGRQRAPSRRVGRCRERLALCRGHRPGHPSFQGSTRIQARERLRRDSRHAAHASRRADPAGCSIPGRPARRCRCHAPRPSAAGHYGGPPGAARAHMAPHVRNRPPVSTPADVPATAQPSRGLDHPARSERACTMPHGQATGADKHRPPAAGACTEGGTSRDRPAR